MDWVVVVDDDVMNLKMAGRILSRNNAGYSTEIRNRSS